VFLYRSILQAAARTAAASLLALAIGSASGCSRHPKAYVLGAAAPQQLEYGASNLAGIQLALAEINAAGGIHGVPLKVEVRDDRASGEQAVRVAAAFVQNPDVIAVIGHAGSGAMVPAARVYDAGKLVALGTTPSTPDLTGMSRWVFRLISSDSVNGITLANFASAFSTQLGRQPRAAILYTNDAYGRGLSEAFAKHFTGEIVSDDPVGTGTNFEPYVA
jgi:branched-chain amino acid transport system substrate-binding protein